MGEAPLSVDHRFFQSGSEEGTRFREESRAPLAVTVNGHRTAPTRIPTIGA